MFESPTSVDSVADIVDPRLAQGEGSAEGRPAKWSPPYEYSRTPPSATMNLFTMSRALHMPHNEVG